MNTSKEQLLEELGIHKEHGNISITLYEQLKIYIENGGNLDTKDWLFFIEYKFTNEESLDIETIQIERHTIITFNAKSALSILKDAGFFQNKDCPQKTLIDKKIKHRQFIEESVLIALQDNSKAIMLDMEADVCRENSSYTIYLKEMEELSNKFFQPTEIKETWKSEEGPIEVSFTNNGNEYIVKPEYWDDWYDVTDLNQKINRSIESKGVGFYSLTSSFTGGQDVLILFLTNEEKAILEKEFGWQMIRL